jgi:hypothetical protein
VSPWRRLLGVPLGIAIEVVLCIVCGGILDAIDPGGLFLLFGVAQALPATPIAIVCWRKDLKATALTLAVSSALVLLLIGGGGVLVWVACAQGGRIGG